MAAAVPCFDVVYGPLLCRKKWCGKEGYEERLTQVIFHPATIADFYEDWEWAQSAYVHRLNIVFPLLSGWLPTADSGVEAGIK